MDSHSTPIDPADDCEIPLDDEEEAEERQQQDGGDAEPGPGTAPDGEQPVAMKTLTPQQLRMQQVLLKMNQARQLNRQAVQEEGTNQVRPDKSRGKSGNKKDKVDPVTSEQASDAILKAQQRADRQETARHSMHDYHNAEAQHLQYQRSLRSIHRDASVPGAADTATFDPLSAAGGRSQAEERRGAHRLAQELHRRIEKKRKNDAKKKDKEEDVAGHINKRNKQFNKKLERNYGDQVSEIQQNLERGTAL